MENRNSKLKDRESRLEAGNGYLFREPRTQHRVRELRTPNAERRQGIPVVLLIGALLLSATAVIARDSPPAVPPPKPLVLPAPAVRTLPNGLQVVVIERHTLPMVTLRVVVKSGAEADPKDLPGTATFVAGLLNEGTTSRSAQKIAETIDDVGGVTQNGAEWDGSFLTLTVLSDHTDLAFDLMADMIMHPAFAPAEVERGRRQMVSSLKILHDDPSYLADAVFNEQMFYGLLYSHPSEGTLESASRITPESLHTFHDEHYRPDNAILAVVGDVTAAGAFGRAERYFGGWEKKKAGGKPLLTLLSVRSRQIVAIDKPDAVQTEIRIGNLGIRRDSPDFIALTMANEILGGPASNRLFHSLRSEHGLAYGASSDLVCNQTVGDWVAKTSTRTTETMKALKLMLEEMKRLREHAPGDTELDTTRSYLTGHLALEFETEGDIAAQELELMTHGLPLDYWNRFPSELQELSRNDVWQRTRQYLDPDNALIVLVGDVSGFEKDLKKLGPVRIIPIGKLDLGAVNLERGTDR